MIYKKTVLFWIQKKNCSSSTTTISAAAPQPITAADPPPKRPAHQSQPVIDNSTSTSITANYHNQDTSTRRFTAFNNPQRHSHSRSLFLATQISVTNHLPQPPLTRTLQQQHQPQRHHPQCHRLQQRQQINMLLSSSDPTAPSLAPPSPNRITKPRFLRHRHQQRQQITGGREEGNISWQNN